MRVSPTDGYTEPHGKPSASCLTPKLASSASAASLGASQMESAIPFIGLKVIFIQLKLTFRIVWYTFDVLGTGLVRGSFVVLIMVSLNHYLDTIIQAERLSEGLPRPRSGSLPVGT